MKEYIVNKIDSGKQLGKTFSFENQSEVYWSSVAIQKWNDVYKVYIDCISEKNMNAENYEYEYLETFEKLDDAAVYMKKKANIDINSLKPCKGSTIFNPEFDMP